MGRASRTLESDRSAAVPAILLVTSAFAGGIGRAVLNARVAVSVWWMIFRRLICVPSCPSFAFLASADRLVLVVDDFTIPRVICSVGAVEKASLVEKSLAANSTHVSVLNERSGIWRIIGEIIDGDRWTFWFAAWGGSRPVRGRDCGRARAPEPLRGAERSIAAISSAVAGGRLGAYWRLDSTDVWCNISLVANGAAGL